MSTTVNTAVRPWQIPYGFHVESNRNAGNADVLRVF